MPNKAVDDAIRQAYDAGWAVVAGLSPADLRYWCVTQNSSGRRFAIMNNSSGESVSKITPRSKKEAPSNSLSGKYGIEKFAAHTDGANLVRPPVLVWLWLSKGKTKTRILQVLRRGPDLDSIRDCLDRGIFRVGNGPKAFLSPALCATRTLRFDEGCMEAQDKLATRVTHFLRDLESRAIEHQWMPGEALLLDNRTVMHSRDALVNDDGDRELLRMWMSPLE